GPGRAPALLPTGADVSTTVAPGPSASPRLGTVSGRGLNPSASGGTAPDRTGQVTCVPAAPVWSSGCTPPRIPAACSRSPPWVSPATRRGTSETTERTLPSARPAAAQRPAGQPAGGLAAGHRDLPVDQHLGDAHRQLVRLCEGGQIGH